MYHNLQRTPSKSQAFARQICFIAETEWNTAAENLSEREVGRLADEALRRFPGTCDIRFRKMAIGRLKAFQRFCKRQVVLRRLCRESWL